MSDNPIGNAKRRNKYVEPRPKSQKSPLVASEVSEIDQPPQPTNATAKTLNTRQRQRMAIGRQKRLDSSIYEEAEPDKQFMWINDLDGEVQKWLAIGAAPVEQQTLHGKIYPGLNDHGANEYVKSHGGADEGGRPFYVYLLKMDRDEYHTVKIQPLKDRQNEIREAMGLGVGGVDSNSDVLPSGNSIQTYAANNLAGTQGFDQVTQEG